MKIKNYWKLNSRFIEANSRNFRLILFSFIVGLVVGTVSGFFRLILTRIEDFSLGLYTDAGSSGILSYILPVLSAVFGVSIALFLVKKIAPEASGSGVHEIEGALDGLRPLHWKRVIPVKFFASLFSLGSGLLLGREGPTIQLGGNIGKMIKDVFNLKDEENNPLVSSGAAAGLASAFNAPLAGIVFVIEEMHGHFKFNFYSVAAIMIASGTADFTVREIIGQNPVIQMTIFPVPELSGMWLFIILGLVFSVVGLVFNKLLLLSLKIFDKLSKYPAIVIGAFVGLIIALIGVLSPDMLGGGYHIIAKVLNQSFTLKFLLFLFLIRMILSVFSYGSGVPGGIFAPLLALGVILGMMFGNIMQDWFPELVQHPGIFAIAGIAGIFASTVKAPLTGLILAIEMTANYELILPLIIISVTTSVATTLLGNKPIYTVLLERTLLKSEKASMNPIIIPEN